VCGATIVAGGVDTSVQFIYQSTDDGSGNEKVIPDSNDWVNAGPPTTFTTDGSKTLTHTLSEGTWFVGMRVWNGFNNASVDRIEIDQGTTRHQVGDVTSTNKFVTPGISSCITDGFYVEATWDYGDAPSTYSARISVNGGDWENGQQNDSTNWGTSTNPKTGEWNTDSFFNFGDTIEIQIKADAEGGVSESDWSGSCTENF
jgi:hypothetical protein